MRAPHSQTDRESSDALKCLDRKGEDQIVEEREALQRIDRRRELVAKEVPARGKLPGVEVVGRCGRRDARLGEPAPRHRDRPERVEERGRFGERAFGTIAVAWRWLA